MAERSKNTDKPTIEDFQEFIVCNPSLQSFLSDMRALSSKKQDAALNALKVKMINRTLTRVKNILRYESSDAFLDLLDDEALPTNSDALLILGQFDSACVGLVLNIEHRLQELASSSCAADCINNLVYAADHRPTAKTQPKCATQRRPNRIPNAGDQIIRPFLTK